MWRRRVAVVAGLALCGVVALVAVRYVVGARDQGTAGTVVQGLAAVFGPLFAAAWWLTHRWRRRVPGSDLGRAADDLAARIGEQWLETARQRGLIDRLLGVRWVWSSRGLSGPVFDAIGDQRAPRFVALPGVTRAEALQLERGDLHDLFTIYGGLDSGRIILVGAPGAGKSAAMIRLLLDALTHRAGIRDAQTRRLVPVPVLLTAYDWLPEHEELSTWVVRRLEAEHPYLKASAGALSAARMLVDIGAVSVLVDGVDEMPEAARTAVLRQVGRQAGFRVVLSGRTDELAGAVASGHLDGAAALELLAVESAQAADYLFTRVIHPTPEPWEAVIRHLRNNSDGALAQALDTPLMLSLLMETYLPYDPVSELADPQLFPTRQQIEDHLLARVLPTAYAPRPGALAVAYSLDQAQRWLGYLAAQMNREGTRDLAWWRISRWLPADKRSWIFGSTFAVAAGLAAGLANGPGAGLALGFVGCLAGVVGSTPVTASYKGFPRQHRSLGETLRPIFKIEVAFGLFAGLLGGFGIGFVAGLGFNFLDWLGHQRGFGFVGSAKAPQVPVLGFGIAFQSAVGLASIGGLVILLAVMVMSVWGVSLPTDSLATPIDSWRNSRRLLSVIGLAVGLMGGFVGGLVDWSISGFTSRFMNGFIFGLVIGLIGGFVIGYFIRGSGDLFYAACAAFLQLKHTGDGPLRMMNFLEDARSRGILRTAGPVYQFRHARLQDLLAVPQNVDNVKHSFDLTVQD